MNGPHAAARMAPRVGDLVVLRGTRVIGEVARIDPGDEHDRVSVKVTAVAGKAHGSKMARAWQGAWLTCSSAMVSPLPPPSRN